MRKKIDLSKSSILLIDDEIYMLDLMKQLLEFTGASVKTCSSSRAAKIIIENEDFDVIISDVCMPDLTGVDLLVPYNTLPNKKADFILLSGACDFTESEQLEIGAKAFLTKPISYSTLIEAISE